MDSSLQQAVMNILSNPKTSELLKNLGASPQNDSNSQNAALPKVITDVVCSPKMLEIQKKIDVLQSLKPLFGQQLSTQIDLIINALSIAKVICSLDEKQ